MNTPTVLDDGERISNFLQHVRAGCDVSKSCRVTGLVRASFYRWMEEATALRANTPPEDWSTYQQKVVAFAESYELAKAQSVTSLELVIAQAARSDWRAAKEMLKRLHPDRWSDNSKVELSGPQGEPVQLAAAVPTYDMSSPANALAVWKARQQMGDTSYDALIAAAEAMLEPDAG